MEGAIAINNTGGLIGGTPLEAMSIEELGRISNKLQKMLEGLELVALMTNQSITDQNKRAEIIPKLRASIRALAHRVTILNSLNDRIGPSGTLR